MSIHTSGSISISIDEDEVVAAKIALMGPSGTGKTYGALTIAHGMAKELKRTTGQDHIVGMIDTENNSGRLFKRDFPYYKHFGLTPPFTVDTYLEAINLAQEHGVSILIIDSTSHAWKRILEEKDKVDQKPMSNSYINWGPFKKKFQLFTDAILQSPMHMICTMRSKTEYVQEKNTSTGRTTVTKKGMGAIQEPEIEYEFTLVLETRHPDNYSSARKDRTKLWRDGREALLTERDGIALVKWLSNDTPKPPEVAQAGERDDLRRASFNRLVGTVHFPITKDDKIGLCNYIATLIDRKEPFAKLSEMSQHDLDLAQKEFDSRQDAFFVLAGALETEGFDNQPSEILRIVEDITKKTFGGTDQIAATYLEETLEKLEEYLSTKKNLPVA